MLHENRALDIGIIFSVSMVKKMQQTSNTLVLSLIDCKYE